MSILSATICGQTTISSRPRRLPQAFFHYYWDDILVVIDLFLDSGAAGVPAAFEQELIHYGDGRIMMGGLALSIVVQEDNVNTILALRELGLLQD